MPRQPFESPEADGEKPMLTLVSVESREDGDIEVETSDGQMLSEACVALDVLCLVGNTGQKMPLTLVVPVSAGGRLLQHLLTDEQFDAVLSV